MIVNLLNLLVIVLYVATVLHMYNSHTDYFISMLIILVYWAQLLVSNAYIETGVYFKGHWENQLCNWCNISVIYNDRSITFYGYTFCGKMEKNDSEYRRGKLSRKNIGGISPLARWYILTGLFV